MHCRSLCHALAIVACVLIAAPAWGADNATDPPPPSTAVEGSHAIGDVQALIDAGRFEEAIVALRPLLGQEPVDANVLFLYGLASLEASQRPGRADEDREILLNEAIAAFRAMLVNRPDLVRVRLELARAFFLRGRDGLARRHFEAALAGGVPPRRWPPTSIAFWPSCRPASAGPVTSAPPLRRTATSTPPPIARSSTSTPRSGACPSRARGILVAESGFGLSVWGGGEYQQRQPGNERLKLRLGADTAMREYPGGDFDQFFSGVPCRTALAARPAHRDEPARPRRSASGSAASPYADEFGGRLELDRRLTPGIWARGTVRRTANATT